MRIVLPVLVLLAGCSGEAVPTAFNAQAKADEQAAKERAADNRAVGAGFAPAQPEPLKTVSVDPLPASAPGAMLPPGDRQYRYIGRWARTAAQCTGGVWKLETRKLTTADGDSCDLPIVAAKPSGYELRGSCKTNGTKTDQTVRLTFDEQRRTMHVAGGTLGAADLLYCGN